MYIKETDNLYIMVAKFDSRSHHTLLEFDQECGILTKILFTRTVYKTAYHKNMQD